MRHSLQEWRVFCIYDFVMFNRQMILFLRKMYILFVYVKKKVVPLPDNLISCQSRARMELQIK